MPDDNSASAVELRGLQGVARYAGARAFHASVLLPAIEAMRAMITAEFEHRHAYHAMERAREWIRRTNFATLLETIPVEVRSMASHPDVPRTVRRWLEEDRVLPVAKEMERLVAEAPDEAGRWVHRNRGLVEHTNDTVLRAMAAFDAAYARIGEFDIDPAAGCAIRWIALAAVRCFCPIPSVRDRSLRAIADPSNRKRPRDAS